MKPIALVLLLAVLAACTMTPPATPVASPAPDDPRAPAADMPYRPVMAGTAYHGIGSKP
jgi:hypothetical protein